MSEEIKETALPNGIDADELQNQIQYYITEYQNARLAKLRELKLRDVLKRKNPYLYRSKNITTCESLVRELLSAYLSAQEETIFGEVMEKLAIYVSSKVDGGWKSSSPGIDLEFDRDGIRYLISIKSGINWGNSSQTEKLKDHFKTATRILRTTNSQINTRCINGCCYGKANSDKGEYIKMAGQTFWTFLTKDEDFYLDIIKPFGYKVKENTEAFENALGGVINSFTADLITDFCVPNTGQIDWNKITKYVSEEKKKKVKTTEKKQKTKKEKK